jgi:hypothetical protein
MSLPSICSRLSSHMQHVVIDALARSESVKRDKQIPVVPLDALKSSHTRGTLRPSLFPPHRVGRSRSFKRRVLKSHPTCRPSALSTRLCILFLFIRHTHRRNIDHGVPRLLKYPSTSQNHPHIVLPPSTADNPLLTALTLCSSASCPNALAAARRRRVVWNVPVARSE